MLRHLTDWLKEVAGLWMMVGILTVAFLVFSAAKHFGFTANSKIAEVNQELSELPYEKYNGINLSGSEVINAIKRYQKELPVTVYTGESVDTYKGNFMPANNSRKSEKYIKPSQIYTGSVLKNADKEIVGLVFAREGIIPMEASYKELLAGLVGADAEKSDINGLIEQLSRQMAEKNGNIEDLTKKTASLGTTVTDLQEKNNMLSTQVSALNGQIEMQNTKYNSLLNEVSSGKSAIASAITNKGISTLMSDSFSTMATNIGKIKGNLDLVTGKIVGKWVSGSGYTSTYAFTTTELSFNPSLLCATLYADSGTAVIYAINDNGKWIIYNSLSGNVDTSISCSGNGFTLSAYAVSYYSNTPYINFYAFR